MLKVADIVADLINSNELALESMRAGLLNLSAYADKIHSQVENATLKEVQKGTIVVALSRLAKDTIKEPQLKPEVKVKNLKLTSSLACVSFEKTADLQRKIAVLHPFQIAQNDLFAITEGASEVTLICNEGGLEEITKKIKAPIKSHFTDLVAITLSLPEHYAQTPNVYHVLINALASKRINIIEVVSTYTEISFLVAKEDMEEALKALNLFFGKRSNK